MKKILKLIVGFTISLSIILSFTACGQNNNNRENIDVLPKQYEIIVENSIMKMKEYWEDEFNNKYDAKVGNKVKIINTIFYVLKDDIKKEDLESIKSEKFNQLIDTKYIVKFDLLHNRNEEGKNHFLNSSFPNCCLVSKNNDYNAQYDLIMSYHYENYNFDTPFFVKEIYYLGSTYDREIVLELNK